ncbi:MULTISPECIES: molecular chaperone [Shewanella]|uniref:Putative chaperone protein n=1 Tax=Shewanella fodinae TaxID=552357 RepID=A0A4R2F2Y8_9GAMM|nr:MULTISPECIES: molecular chaperone [Shewanella]MBO1271718.1 molecular chaperone [Shewanella sp. 4t3-1-2LB]TCN79619.1 putative chaperone protein [Shewanella fodinae]
MFIGFDYGTSNCSVARMLDGEPQLLPLENTSHYLPSTLAAPTRESVSEYLFRHYQIQPLDAVGQQLLRRSVAANREEGIDLQAEDLLFGQAALALYLAHPQDLYYVKSPKSFLGAMGLHEVQLSFFEDLVCAMMANIKRRAEQVTQQTIDDAVIGRPINFQGSGGEESNRQAENILRRAANRAGFRQVEFQFEPVAAGLEYEAGLTQEQIVLVVDIGGGTTDCSLLRMGPNWRKKKDRSGSLLAHSGQRVGGNDLDIHLAFRQLMPYFGLGSLLDSGLEMPMKQLWNPVAINDLSAQNDFYAQRNLAELKLLHKEAREPQKLARLLQVYHDTLGYSLVRRAEEAKIALSQQAEFHSTLALATEVLPLTIRYDEMLQALDGPKQQITKLVREALTQGDSVPDVIFMTGGSARSPLLRQAVAEVLPQVPLVSGNDFGSVTAGLARWAEVCFG